MDDHLVTFGCEEHDDLEEVGGAVGPDEEPAVGVFANGVDDHGVFDSMEHVVVGNAVTAGGGVDLHTTIL